MVKAILTDAGTITQEIIEGKILLIRGKKVMMDRDLAKLYEVSTGRFNEQVKRNIKRFPEDFMFLLKRKELRNLISQFAISSWGGTRKLPYVFTEQGVAMLSSVLNSERAIMVNIQIIRTFTRLREMLMTQKNLREKIETMEKKYDGHFQIVFNAIKKLMEPPPKKRKRRIGFHQRD
ncbi:MAG: ORF6N domain-containing protein [Candidatus Tantalella remota]|nr:ORF6N domain-containing protein [Candidatus Tantalella remota]